MNNVINWVRNNPLTLAAGIVLLVALGFTYWVYSQSSELKTAIEERQREVRELQAFMQQDVTLPPQQLGGEPTQVSNVTFNEATIRQLDNIFSNLNSEAESITAAALEINRRNHPVLVEGVFPTLTAAANVPFEFRGKYRHALQTLMGPRPAAAALGEELGLDGPTPYLNAGLPPRPEELQQVLERVVSDGRRAFGTLSEQRARELRDEAQTKMLNAIRDRASQIHIYADPSIQLSNNTFNPDFPLSVFDWAFNTSPPQPWQMWEGQFEYWIQSDIVAAIARVNGSMANGGGDGDAPASVLEAPIKRLLKLEVLPGSVGLHTPGGVGTLGGAQATSGRGGIARGGRGSAGGAGLKPSSLPAAPAPGELGAPDQNDNLGLNFQFAPTGRRSTFLADVRHVRLHIHADYHRLPAFINALGQVNLMSVTDMQIRAVDEYDFAALGGPYLYGDGEVVEVEMIIETQWLREWMIPMLPPVVRESLGIPEPAADGADANA